VLRETFGYGREKKVGEYFIINIFRLCECCSISPEGQKSKRMRWAGRVARLEDNRNTYRVLMGKFVRKETLHHRA
jgi:hypothetical protein